MKKMLAILCSLALVCSMFLGSSTETRAVEPDSKELKVTMTPQKELVAGEEVTFNISVTNPTEESMTVNGFDKYIIAPEANGTPFGKLFDEEGQEIVDNSDGWLVNGIDFAGKETKNFTLTGTLPETWGEWWIIRIQVMDGAGMWYGSAEWFVEPGSGEGGEEKPEASVDWEKGEYSEAGKTYYLLDVEFGDGVLGYQINWSGPEDVKMVEKDGKTYYFVLPNSQYPLNYSFDIDEKYKDMNNPGGLKDGYEMQVVLASGEGQAKPAGHGAPEWVIQFTTSKASTFEVSVVEKKTDTPDTKPENAKEIVDKNSGVSMKLPATAPEGLTLKVTASNGKAEKDAVAKLVNIDGDKIKTFDLSLMKDGVVWEYDGQFKSTVTLPVPEGWNLDLLGLYYFDEATGKATAVPFTVDKENGTISFETDHFSRFVLVQKEAEQTASVTAKSPKTGDEANTALYTMMLFVAGATMVASLRRKRA